MCRSLIAAPPSDARLPAYMRPPYIVRMVAMDVRRGDRSMKFNVSLAASGKYVLCQVLEPVTTEFALEFGKATADFSHYHGINRQLYDCRNVRNIDSVYHNYDFAYKDMEQLELDPLNRVAILVDPSDRSHDFVQITMRNAGYSVKIFIDEAQAIAWLEDV